MSIAQYVDHTVLKPTTTEAEARRVCEEALVLGCAAVCLPPYFVRLAKDLLAETPVKVATVIGFPFGYSNSAAKLAEAHLALDQGCDELDMVINLIALRNNDWRTLDKEARLITGVTHDAGRKIKMIIESGILTDEEIIRCCQLYTEVGVDFVKTSTGYAEKGASVHAVALMRSHLPASISIKASGGIRTFEFARELLQAGADRLGCSATVQIVAEEKQLNG